MLRKSFAVSMLLLVLAALLLSACNGATDTIQSTYFRRVASYTTATEAPGLMDGFSSDMSPDQVVEFVTKWSKAKYLTSSTKVDGYEAKNRLNILHGSVGLLQVGAHQVILPPRMYPTLPDGEDEVKVEDALCVPAGQVAWRFNYSSQMEIKPAREECYPTPKAGWDVISALRVEQGWLAYRMTEDGSYEFRGPNPGAYPNEIASRWIYTQALQLLPGTFGVYVKPNGEMMELNVGIHYDVVPSFVDVYKASEMRYRTLDVAVYKSDPRPESPACASELCETIVDRIPISGTSRLAEFNVEITFSVINPTTDRAALERYRNMGSMSAAIIDYIEGPTRNAVRAVGKEMEQKYLETEAGKLEFGQRVMDRVQAKIDAKGAPFKVTGFGIRGQNFNDTDLRAAMAEAEVELQRQNARAEIAAAEAKAVEAELRAQDMLQQLVAKKLEAIMKLGSINLTDGIDCTELLFLDRLGIITIEWDKVPAQVCPNGTTTISVNTLGDVAKP